jgi:hypothetical protein
LGVAVSLYEATPAVVLGLDAEDADTDADAVISGWYLPVRFERMVAEFS